MPEPALFDAFATTLGDAIVNSGPPGLPDRSWPSAFCAFSADPRPIAICPSVLRVDVSTWSRNENSPPIVPCVTCDVSTGCAWPLTTIASCCFVGSCVSGCVCSVFAVVPTTSGWPLPTNRLSVPSDCGRAVAPMAPEICCTRASRWSSRSFGCDASAALLPSLRIALFSDATCFASELTVATWSSI